VNTPEFSIKHSVQFSETDAAGVVHFSNYFRWMEMVEHAFFRSLGLSVMMTHEAVEIGWPRIACSCEYHGPARFEDEVTLKLRVTKVGGKSLSYEVDFLKGDALLAKGKLTSVCVALQDATFKAIAIPPAMRDKLGSSA
jgi:acyl-CoA thioester hydrolase